MRSSKRTPSITRRAATDADKDFLRDIHHRAYRDVVTRQFGAWDEALQDEFFEKNWSGVAYEILLFDHRACGYVAVENFTDHIFVRELVIAPEFQGKGIGSAVLRAEMEKAAAKCVRLQTLLHNRAAKLYERLGFREYGRTETHVKMEMRNS